MTTEVFEALQTCISLARHQRVPSFPELRAKAMEAGHHGADVDAALALWRLPEHAVTDVFGSASNGRFLH